MTADTTLPSTTLPAPTLPSPWRGPPLPLLLALGLGALLLGLMFHTEVQAAVAVWYDSTAYSHCFLVLPIAVYLGWERRKLLVGLAARPVGWVALGAIPLGLAWLVAERLGLMEGRQLIAIATLELLFLAVLGWRLYAAMAAPLLYLFFLVPFGAFLTPVLQDFTAAFSNLGLTVLGIPHYSDAYLIEIPEGRFLVAEACAGLRFLIASIAFGALYACLMYTSTTRRALFMLASIVVPIVANGFRALGIVVLGHFIGNAEAAAADHILYGWVFFSIVIMLLILAGLPFRQDPATVPPRSAGLPPAPVPAPRTLYAPVVGVVGLLAGIIGFAGWLDRGNTDPSVVPMAQFATPTGCAPPVAVARNPGLLRLKYTCNRAPFEVTVQLFSPRVNPARIQAAQLQLTGEQGIEDVTYATLDIGRPWRVVSSERPPIVSATALWVNGSPARGGIAGRVALARNSLVGATSAPVLIAVTATESTPPIPGEDSRQLRARIELFLRAQTTLPALIAQLSNP